MSPFLQLMFELAILLLAAKAAGYIALRLGQPSVLGELIAGILLGPSLINILKLQFINSSSLGEMIEQMSNLGVLLMMFIAGLELHVRELAQNRKTSLTASAGGLLLSIALGWAVGRAFGMGNLPALVIGLAIGATSVSISARTLMEMGKLRNRVGLSLLGAAVVDDILTILVFAVFVAISAGNGGGTGIGMLVIRMGVFFILAIGFGLWVLPYLARKIVDLPINMGALTFSLVIMLVYGLAAETIGHMAAIIGTFLAGLMLGRTPLKEQIETGINALAHGLFIPLFFINIGLSVDVKNMPMSALWLVPIITLAAIVGKLLGAGLSAKTAGMEWRESWQVGAGMIARGEVTLIIAAAGIQASLIREETLSILVAVVFITVLVTPPLLKSLFKSQDKIEGEAE